MKKFLALVLALVLMLATLALVACAESQTVTGECFYESWGTPYGAKVDVTVKCGIITNVRLYTDAETNWYRTSKNGNGWDGYEMAEAAYANWIEDAFVGQKVEDVKAFVANPQSESKEYVGPSTPKIAGASVSAARIILAVQDALNKLAD